MYPTTYDDIKEVTICITQEGDNKTSTIKAPDGITANTSDSYINIKWNAVSGATKYKVYRSSSSSGSYSLISTVTTNNATDYAPLSGYNYYKVTALNSYNESEYSSYTYAYISSGGNGGGNSDDDDIPLSPSNVTATNLGNNYIPEIKISWNSVSNATTYKIYRSNNSSSGYTLLGTSSYTHYTNWNPQSGKNYYKVKAVNSAGESGYSSYALFNYDTSSSLVPGTPTVTTSGTSSIYISWRCPSGNNYGKANSYEIYKRDPDTGKYELIKSTTSTSYTDSNTHPGINRYAVIAKNDAGNSGEGYGYSESITLSYPTSFSAKKSGSYIEFTWSKVAKATGYQIFSSNSASGNYYILKDIDNVNTTSISVYYPQSSGTKEYFKIKAYWQTSYGGSPIYSNYSSYKSITF